MKRFGGLTKTMSYQYTPDSLVSQVAYPDGTLAGRNYNSHRLLYQTLVGSGTQATFGAADRVTGETQTLPGLSEATTADFVNG